MTKGIQTRASAIHGRDMAAAVLMNADASEVLVGAHEVSLLFDFELEPGSPTIPMKARIDCLGTGPWFADLKTTTDASPEGFGREAVKWRYHLKMALYHDAVKALIGEAPRTLVVAVEKEPPHFVGCYEFDEDALDLGRLRYREAVETWLRCQKDGWPTAYTEGVQTLRLPKWA